MRHTLICLFFLSFLISKGQISFSVVTTPESCPGCCDGTAQITNLSGGCPPYTVSWQPSGFGFYATNLCAGSYTPTIFDSGCSSAAFQICSIGGTTGIYDQPTKADAFPVFINPSLSRVNFNSELLPGDEISISNISGKEIYYRKFTEACSEIETKLESGMYFLSIKRNIQQLTKKILIQNFN
jgi:hypothetical protein